MLLSIDASAVRWPTSCWAFVYPYKLLHRHAKPPTTVRVQVGKSLPPPVESTTPSHHNMLPPFDFISPGRQHCLAANASSQQRQKGWGKESHKHGQLVSSIDIGFDLGQQGDLFVALRLAVMLLEQWGQLADVLAPLLRQLCGGVCVCVLFFFFSKTYIKHAHL